MNTQGASSLISLPKGDSALHGNGQKLSPDLHTDTGNFTVPISLFPDHNVFQFQINLVYSTGQSNGPSGIGWWLDISGITRKTLKRIPRYRDGSDDNKKQDIFILSDVEDLVPIRTLESGIMLYRLRTEGFSAQIEHHLNTINDFWVVCSEARLVSRYGTADQKRTDPAVIAAPERNDQPKIFARKLTSTTNPLENLIEYEYERNTGQDGPHHWDHIQLKRIRYVDHVINEQINFFVEVTFDYEDRIDPFSDYRSEFEIRMPKQCTKISINTNTGEEKLVRTYELINLDQRPDQLYLLPINRTSQLSQNLVTGHDEENTESLPPLEFSNTQSQPANVQLTKLERDPIPYFDNSQVDNSIALCRFLFFLAYVLLAAAVAISSGCAVHYYDAENNIEHIWGIGHMAMKPSSATEGVVAVGRRTDVIGLSLANVQDQLDVTFGWNAKQRIDIVKEDVKLCLAWPQGSFYSARAGTNFPQAASTCGTSTTKEVSP